MCIMAEQCVIIQYLLELSKSLNALATNTNMIKNFFKKYLFYCCNSNNTLYSDSKQPIRHTCKCFETRFKHSRIEFEREQKRNEILQLLKCKKKNARNVSNHHRMGLILKKCMTVYLRYDQTLLQYIFYTMINHLLLLGDARGI